MLIFLVKETCDMQKTIENQQKFNHHMAKMKNIQTVSMCLYRILVSI